MQDKQRSFQPERPGDITAYQYDVPDSDRRGPAAEEPLGMSLPAGSEHIHRLVLLAGKMRISYGEHPHATSSLPAGWKPRYAALVKLCEQLRGSRAQSGVPPVRPPLRQGRQDEGARSEERRVG